MIRDNRRPYDGPHRRSHQLVISVEADADTAGYRQHGCSNQPVAVGRVERRRCAEIGAVVEHVGRHNVTTLVERGNRYLILIKNSGRNSKGVMAALAKCLEPLPPPMRQSITFDRSTEFTFLGILGRLPEIDSDFSKPKKARSKTLMVACGASCAAAQTSCQSEPGSS